MFYTAVFLDVHHNTYFAGEETHVHVDSELSLQPMSN